MHPFSLRVSLVGNASDLEVGHDRLEHAWGWAQVGGAVVALVALVIALRSSKDAREASAAAGRSADAAERTAASSAETAQIAAEELAMLKGQAARVPRLQLVAFEPHDFLERAPHTVIVEWEIGNFGDDDAEGVAFNVFVPPGTDVGRVANLSGEKFEPLNGSLAPSAAYEDFLRGPLYAAFWTIPMTPAGQSSFGYLVLTFTKAGTHSVLVAAGHPRSSFAVVRSLTVS